MLFSCISSEGGYYTRAVINGANTAVFQDASVQFLLFLDLSICMILVFILSLIYRTRAISGRSRLVAAPLRNHAKRQFL